MTLLDAMPPGAIVARVFFLATGIAGLWVGLSIRHESTPQFVVNYRGGPSRALGLPFGGIGMLSLFLGDYFKYLPPLLVVFIGGTGVLCILVWLSSFLIRFPRFLTPAWYRRALKAGVPRHDPHLMGKFKALPKETQKQLVLLRREHEAAPHETPGTETS